MPTPSGVSKRFQQHLCKDEATYITSRQKAPYFSDAMYLNSEKYEPAIVMKYREINSPAFIFCRGDIFQSDDLFHTGARPRF